MFDRILIVPATNEVNMVIMTGYKNTTAATMYQDVSMALQAM